MSAPQAACSFAFFLSLTNRRPRSELVINLPSTGYGPAVSSSFAVNFSKSYVAAGLLAPGRALLIVSTGWGGTGFSAFPSSTTCARGYCQRMFGADVQSL